jgi:hypothetical protein
MTASDSPASTDRRCCLAGGNHVISTPTSYTPWAQEKGA